MEARARVKKWGNSFGIVIPKNIADKLDIKEEDEVVVDVNVSGKSDVLRKSWGLGKKARKSAQEWKDEFRRTLY